MLPLLPTQGGPQLTSLCPELDILLAGVDGICGLSAHVVEMGTQQAPLAEVNGDVHMKLLQDPYFFSLPHCAGVFL